jgi:cation:H+ antiporter
MGSHAEIAYGYTDMDWLLALSLLAGFALLVGGADFLVDGASRIAAYLGVSTFVIGLTVVAYGTSAPELAVNLGFLFDEIPRSGLLVGTVIGSNISNFLLVLGLSAILRPMIKPDGMNAGLIMMVAVTIAAYILSLDQNIAVWEGWLMVSACICVTVMMYYSGRSGGGSNSLKAPEFGQESDSRQDLTGELGFPYSAIGIILLGVVLLSAGSHLLVDSAVELATLMGVSEFVIGLTVIAVGTSIPELATSLVAILKRDSGIAIGNIVGSNIFNFLFVMATCSAVSGLDIVIDAEVLSFEFPFLLIVTIVSTLVIILKGKVSRWFGSVLFAYFILFLVTRYGWLSYMQGVPLALSWCAPLIIIGAVFVLSRLFSLPGTENLQND